MRFSPAIAAYCSTVDVLTQCKRTTLKKKRMKLYIYIYVTYKYTYVKCTSARVHVHILHSRIYTHADGYSQHTRDTRISQTYIHIHKRNHNADRYTYMCTSNATQEDQT